MIYPFRCISIIQVFSLLAGIRKFGDRGLDAAVKEIAQLHGRDCFKPINIDELSHKERRDAMDALIFITEKRSGKVKARTVADGRKQRGYIMQH